MIEQTAPGVCRGYRWRPEVEGMAAERVAVVLPGRMPAGTPAVSLALAALGDHGWGAVQVWDEYHGSAGDLAHELSDQVLELEDAGHGLGGPKGVTSLLENLRRVAAETVSFADRL